MPSYGSLPYQADVNTDYPFGNPVNWKNDNVAVFGALVSIPLYVILLDGGVGIRYKGFIYTYMSPNNGQLLIKN